MLKSGISSQTSPSIGAVLHVLDHPGYGGAQDVVGIILRELPKFNITSNCFILRRSCERGQITHAPSIIIEPSNSRWSPRAIYHLIRLVKKLRVQILHSHLARSWLACVIVKLFNPKITLVVHDHGDISCCWPLFRRPISVLLNLSNCIISVSHYGKKNLETIGVSSSKIVVLPNPIDFNLINSAPSNDEARNNLTQELGIPFNSTLVGCVGRLAHEKGIDLVIDALPEGADLYLVIAGDGPFRKDLEQLCRHRGISHKVFFLGQRADIYSVMRSLDYLVIPSRSEAFGLVLAEGISLGVSIIASNKGAIPEIIADYPKGIIFNPDDPEELRKLLYECSNHLPLKPIVADPSNTPKFATINSYITSLLEIYQTI